MLSVANICNMALSHLGVSDQITDLATEMSKEALSCKLFYEPCRDEVLRDFPWPFATVIETLALVEEEPNAEWAYSYRYPAGCLKVRRILSGTRNDTQTSTRPYRIARDSAGRLIYCDVEDAEIELTQLVTATDEFDPDFASALSYLLAAKIGPRVASGDNFKLADRALKLYYLSIGKAQNNAAGESRDDEAPDADMITARA